mmetsp:Transcript_6591/g.27135  ORF Transcript_6591/g.27135 Transcript_6591/m.27135 type:complete len:207 (-) Transcript_6591:1010-1630(-)
MMWCSWPREASASPPTEPLFAPARPSSGCCCWEEAGPAAPGEAVLAGPGLAPQRTRTPARSLGRWSKWLCRTPPTLCGACWCTATPATCSRLRPPPIPVWTWSLPTATAASGCEPLLPPWSQSGQTLPFARSSWPTRWEQRCCGSALWHAWWRQPRLPPAEAPWWTPQRRCRRAARTCEPRCCAAVPSETQSICARAGGACGPETR